MTQMISGINYIQIGTETERLSQYNAFSQFGCKPSDFYFFCYGPDFNVKTHIDTFWTDKGFTNPAGAWAMAWSRKTWIYPSLAFEATWPKMAPDLHALIGFEQAPRGRTNRSLFRLSATQFLLWVGDKQETILDITTHLPADYDTKITNEYGLKLNKCNLEAYVNSRLVGIVLFGLPEAIPMWHNTNPYSLGSTVEANISMRVPIVVLLEPSGVMPSFTIGLPWVTGVTGGQVVCNDGDPLPPRQYPLYTENTNTKWNGLATSAVVTSHPIPVWGYPRKTLLFQSSAAGTLSIQVYAGGAWREWASITLVANQLEVYNLNGEMPITRCVYTPVGTDAIAVAEWMLGC